MNVKELIEQLRRMPQDAEVKCACKWVESKAGPNCPRCGGEDFYGLPADQPSSSADDGRSDIFEDYEYCHNGQTDQPTVAKEKGE